VGRRKRDDLDDDHDYGDRHNDDQHHYVDDDNDFHHDAVVR
jgi:hypothetical protein